MDYNKFLNDKVKSIEPSGIRKFFDIAKERKDVITLGVGEPDFVTPFEIREAAIKSIRRGKTGYTANSGLFELRELISKYLKKRYSLNYSSDNEILVTVGASEGIDLSLRAMLSQGDEVLICEPSFVAYAPCVTFAGGKAVSVPCKRENQFMVTCEDIEKVLTKNSKILILPYPNNPTGAIMTKEELEKIRTLVIEKDLFVITDEIYSELTYSEEHFSIAAMKDMKERTIYLNGFSKAFAMTGWRLGYVCGPEEVLKEILKVHQYTLMCASTMSQYAGIEALKQGLEDDFAVVKEMKDEYDLRRRFLFQELSQLGFDLFEPLGAFYVFPSVAPFGMDGDTFAGKLLDFGVAVVPGGSFGKCGKDHVRISYAYSMKNLEKAVERIKKFVASI